MRGHHIYTSSWFKYGSNSKNPGTYTVELTRDIFGSDTDDVIFKLNQMCASVPETLTPRNTNESVLRLYHILPDTTVVSRSWFVTDEITGRGTVPYTHSLIFRGGDNERFLQYPAKSFDISSAEPYKSYLGRVSADAPTELSTKYDPRGEDYKEPFVFSQNEWITDLGLDEDLFAKYYISLGRAVCGKGNTRVAVILRKNMDCEKLILATLSLLPLFMKRKFSAASKWTGMMDGSGSTAVNGIQLLCYYDESPVSESGFPVIDLTGAGRHANIAVPTVTELNYNRWIWRNIDESKKLSEYENFIELTFSSVLDKIPFEVVADSFFLWLKRNVDTYEVANINLVLIAGSFARNFAKFEFINKTLDKVIARLLEKVEASDYDIKRVQAVCLLATNGSASAKKLVDALFYEFFKNGECWDKLAIVLQYYKSVFDTDTNSISQKLYSCITLGDKSKECAKIAHETLVIYCQRLREDILTDIEKSGELLRTYKIYAGALNKASKLPDAFYQFKETTKVNSNNAECFFNLEKLDIEHLEHSPYWEHLVRVIYWTENLVDERRHELWSLYYSKIRKSIGEYIVPLEKAIKVEENGRNQVLAELIESSDDAKREIAEYYKEDFASKWNEAAYTLDSDETWKYVREWLERLYKVPLKGEGVLQFLREKVGLNKDTFNELAECLSNESFQTAGILYMKDGSLSAILQDINEVDSRAEVRDKYFGDLAIKIRDSSMSSICINRMLYWHNKIPNPPAEWAFVIAVARGDSLGFDLYEYLELRKSKTGYAAGIAEVLELFNVVCIAIDNRNPYIYKAVDNRNSYIYKSADTRNPYIYRATDIINSVIIKLKRIDKEYFEVRDVILAFRDLPDSAKDRIGDTIYDVLDKRVDEKIRDEYRTKKWRYSDISTENDDSMPDPIILVILAVFLAFMAGMAELLLSFSGVGNAIIGVVLGKSIALILPYILTVLIMIATLFSAIRILRNGGN